jgi:hypothetical protein
MTADTRSLAETYFRSWKAKDFDTLRSILADDVTFRGPMGEADGVESCLKGLAAMGGMMTDLVIRKIFVDGDDVLTWYDIHTADTPPMPTANWSHVEDGKIATIRATFDPRPITGG